MVYSFGTRSSNLFRAFLFVSWIANGPFAVVTAGSPTVMAVNYTDTNDPDFALMGYLSSPLTQDEPIDSLPAVIILPNWENVADYEQKRAMMIADELGYFAFAADIFGADLHDVQDYGMKIEQATLYNSNPELFRSRIQSAIDVVKNTPGVDPNRIALIGYCMGGTGVLTYAFANTDAEQSDIVGAVSFHGGLMDFEVTGELASPVLVLSGGNDDLGTKVEDLEARLKAANATWQITRYSGVEHGFTIFDSNAYNEWVDQRSWKEMSSFLRERFGEVEYGTDEPIEDMEYTVIGGPISNETMSSDDDDLITVQTVSYDDAGFALEGYLAKPRRASHSKSPAVLIIPDWNGVNGPTGYEAERAVMMAQEGGYVVMVADIFGTEYTDIKDFNVMIEQATKYRSDPELFVSRIQAAFDQLVALPSVDTTNIFVTGYCMGGSGVMDYAFSSGGLQGVKAVVPIHAGLDPLSAIQTDTVSPYVMILAGGSDVTHGNATELEGILDSVSADWEISRYSNANHGFSQWGGPESPYNEMADSRSWWSTMSLFETMSDNYHDHLGHSHDDMGGYADDESSSANRAMAGLSVFGAAAMAALFVALVC